MKTAFCLYGVQQQAKETGVHVVCDDIAEQEPVPNLQPSSSPERSRTYTTGGSEPACRSTTSRTAPKRRSQRIAPGPPNQPHNTRTQPTRRHKHTVQISTWIQLLIQQLCSLSHFKFDSNQRQFGFMVAGSLLFMLTKLQATITIHAFDCFPGLSLSMPSSSNYVKRNWNVS